MKTPDATLSNWDITYSRGYWYLQGTISNDNKKRFKDGIFITTSSIQKINFKKGIAVTKNTVYKLESDYV